MSFIAPLWLAAAGLVALGLVVAHLFSTTVPPQDVFPTVRFIPESMPLTVLRTRRVTDVWLLILRLLAVALLGLALAGAHVRRDAPSRVVVVDASRAVASMAASVDTAAATGSGVFIAFDSGARRITADSLRSLPRSGARGSLSAALVAAHRLLAETADGGERTELVIVSPMVREEVDSATATLLALWEGPVRFVRVPAASAPAEPGWEIRAGGDDPVAATLGVIPGRAATRTSQSSVRLVRTVPTRADSQWAQSSGGVLVVWPATREHDVLLPRATPDTQGGITTRRQVAIAPFVRAFQPRPGGVLVRWTDGEPAATERALGRGCVREVAIPVEAVGDLALRESFRGIARSLLEPCGGAPDFRVDSTVVPSPSPVIPSNARNPQFGARDKSRSLASLGMTTAGSLPLWLAIGAAVVLLAEQMLRARGRRTA